MSAFLTPVQTAFYTRLAAEVSTATTYDDVPGQSEGMPDESFPYIVIGEDDSTSWDTDDTLGSVVLCTLHVFSRYEGKKEVKAVMGAVYDALHRQAANLTATGYRFVDCLHDFSEVVDDNDGVTRHGICRYRVTLEKE